MTEKQRLSESDTIILSLHDRWWKKVLAREKPLEIRKTRPAGKGPRSEERRVGKECM